MGKGGVRLAPARLGFRGMDPRVKPEDDSANKGALLTTEAVEPSVTGSEKRGKGGVRLAPCPFGVPWNGSPSPARG